MVSLQFHRNLKVDSFLLLYILSIMAKVSSQAVNALKDRIDAVTADTDGIPGVVYCAVNKEGDLLFEHASGKVGIGKERDMDMETVFWIASCTKMITGIACMQLVEQRKLELDSVELVEKLAPVSSLRQVVLS